MDVGIELEVVPIKLIHVEVEELVGFALEVGDDAEKVARETANYLGFAECHFENLITILEKEGSDHAG